MSKLRLYTDPSGSRFVEFAAPRPQTPGGTSLLSDIVTRDIDGIWSTFYDSLPNPDPVLRKTNNYIDILNEIKRAPRVSSCIQSRLSGVQLRKWKLEPENAAASSVEFIEKVLKSKDLKLRQAITDILKAWQFGYQISEVIWKRDGNVLVPQHVKGKPARYFHFGRDNELRRKQTAGDIHGIECEAYKFLLTQYQADYENPYGEAQISMCFWPVTLQKGGIKFWAKFLERFGSPHAVGKTNRNASPSERTELLKALKLMVNDAVAVFPDDATVELLNAQVSGSADAYEQFARYHNSEISTVILGHPGSSEATPGKLGNDDTAMKVRADIIENDCSMVEDTINTLIQWIHDLNPSLGVECPRFVLYEETDVDTERADRDVKLMDTGKVKLSKQYFVKNYDFDEEDIEIVESDDATTNVQTPGGRLSPPAPAKKKPEFAAPDSSDSQSDIDALVDKLTGAEKLQSQVEDLLKPVFELIEKSESFDDVKKGIADLYPKMDESKIAGLLEKAMFLGESWGRLKGDGEE